MSWRPRRLQVAIVAAVQFGGGCVTTGPPDHVHNGFKVGPNYCKPPAPVAGEWIEADDPHVETRQLQEWWGVFNDPTLNSLIETAYQQNLNLRVLGPHVLPARAQQAITAGSILPQTQQATGQYSRIGLSKTVANNPAVTDTLQPGRAVPFTPLFGNWYSDWATGFNVSGELDFWGRFRRAIESAASRSLACAGRPTRRTTSGGRRRSPVLRAVAGWETRSRVSAHFRRV